MQIDSFDIDHEGKSAGKVYVTQWPQGGYSARLVESAHRCPSAVGIGDKWFAAVIDLTEQKFARHVAVDIMREALKQPIHH
jgi:hypothetical protein